jgi:zinc transporter 6
MKFIFSVSRYIPGLSKILLPRVNPFVLIGVADLFTLTCCYVLMQMGSSYLIDTYASIIIAVMTIGTMLPLAIYTGKILLQTTPPHLITQLDKSLREASTLDGVLEFRDEHFWTLSLGVLVGSLHIRIRRDADEQLVLAHVWNKLAGLVQILTIHVFKDDWMRRTTHQLIYNQQNVNIPTVTPLVNLNSKVAAASATSGISKTNSQAGFVENDFVIVNP